MIKKILGRLIPGYDEAESAAKDVINYIDSAEYSLRQKDEKILCLHREVNDRDGQICALNAESEAKDGKIVKLMLDAEVSEKLIEESYETVCGLERQAESYERIIMRSGKRILALEQMTESYELIMAKNSSIISNLEVDLNGKRVQLLETEKILASIKEEKLGVESLVASLEREKRDLTNLAGQLESRLRVYERDYPMYRAIAKTVEQAPESRGVVVVDTDDRIVYASPEAERVLNYGEGLLKGGSFLNLFRGKIDKDFYSKTHNEPITLKIEKGRAIELYVFNSDFQGERLFGVYLRELGFLEQAIERGVLEPALDRLKKMASAPEKLSKILKGYYPKKEIKEGHSPA